MKQTIKAKFTGLGKSGSITCETINSQQHIFWPSHTFTKEEFDGLWKYCQRQWSDKKIAIIECDGISNDGTPINPVFKSFEE